MLSDETYVEPEPSPLDDRVAEIYSWRREQLERAGYSPAHAEVLANDESVDLHEACELLERGCPEHDAFLILT
jgi:hypothetical protein